MVHTECKVCEKTTFYSKQEFIRAHGRRSPEPSVWVYKTVRLSKNELIFRSSWICKACRHEEHQKDCKYWFDWEKYNNIMELIRQKEELLSQRTSELLNLEQQISQWEKQRDILNKIHNLENKCKDLLNKELNENKIKQELNSLNPLFLDIEIPYAYDLLAEAYQQLIEVWEKLNKVPPVSISTDKALLAENQTLKKENTTLQAAKTQLEETIDNKDKQVNNLQQTVKDKEQQILKDKHEADKLIKDLDNKLVQLRQEKETLSQSSVDKQELLKLQKEKADLTNQLNAAEKEIKQLKGKIRKLEEKGEEGYETADDLEDKQTLKEWRHDLKEFTDEEYHELARSDNIYLTATYTLKELKKELARLQAEKKNVDWEKVLNEIKEFMKSKPKTLAAIKDKATEILDNYGEPLAGLDLKGIPSALLSSGNITQDKTAKNELKNIKGLGERFRDYTVLSAAGDGNCYLNSLSILLGGKDKIWALPLRVKLILELMTNEKIMEHTYPLDETSSSKVSDGKVNEQNKIGWILYKILDNRDDIHAPVDALKNPKWELAINSRYMATDDIKYYVRLLKRPITVVYPAQGIAANNPDAVASGGFLWSKYPSVDTTDITLDYKEPFFIYRLKGGAHFIPLIRPVNHEEGTLEFKLDKVSCIDDTNGNGGEIKLEFLKGSAQKFDFSPSQEAKFDLTKIDNIVVYLNNPQVIKRYQELKDKFIKGDSKKGRTIIISIIKASEVNINAPDIYLLDNTFEDIEIKKEAK
jgi:hypothetical protein